MRVIGADENGLGPWLGPLVSTAVAIELPRYDAAELAKTAESWGIADSKKSSSFGHMARAEALSLALAERQLGGPVRSMQDFLEAIALDGAAALRAACPGGEAERACWGPPLALPAFGGDAIEGRSLIEGFEATGLAVTHVRTLPACAKALNVARAAGRNKLMMDLHAFERLVLSCAEGATGDVLAVCGLVGGIRRYRDRFAHWQGASVLEERRGLAAYRVPDLGEVRFEIQADARHAPVALASMVGKYVRELFMARLNRHWQARRAASGYHDPVTKALVAATERVRRQRGVPDECFLREA
ncbi:MAG: hypothetical protein GXP55_14375 [Deltaproteobacteria bacterium]|nr:hypothetical protein [Deltaproteobacteria bacterium]